MQPGRLFRRLVFLISSTNLAHLVFDPVLYDQVRFLRGLCGGINRRADAKANSARPFPELPPSPVVSGVVGNGDDEDAGFFSKRCATDTVCSRFAGGHTSALRVNSHPGTGRELLLALPEHLSHRLAACAAIDSDWAEYQFQRPAEYGDPQQVPLDDPRGSRKKRHVAVGFKGGSMFDHDDAGSARQVLLPFDGEREAAEKITGPKCQPAVARNKAPQEVARGPKKQQRDGRK